MRGCSRSTWISAGLESLDDSRVAVQVSRGSESLPSAGVGIRSGGFKLRGRGGPAIRIRPDGRTADRPGGPNSLVQPVRSAARVAGHNSPPRSGRIVVLSPLLHGAAARGRDT